MRKTAALLMTALVLCLMTTAVFAADTDKSEKERAVTKLFGHSGADFVVYNDLSEITKEEHPFKILKSDGECLASGKSNAEMATLLEAILK